MKFTGFASGCFGKALLIILCLILGVVLAIGGEALAIYMVLSSQGAVGQVADIANNAVGDTLLDFDEETRSMSVMQWMGEVLELMGDLTGTEIGDMEKIIGLSLISETISDVMGVDVDKIKASTLDNIGKTVVDNLTIRSAKDRFGITFPSDIPLFQKTEFLDSPFSTAMQDLTDYKLSDFINIQDNANVVLKEMGDVKIKELGGEVTDKKVKGMFLCQIMDIDEDSSRILQTLQYCSIESQYTDETKTDYATKTIVVNGVETEKPLIGLNEKISDLELSDVVDIDDDSHIILRKMRDEHLKVTDLGGARVTEIVNGTKIGELVEITDDSEPLLQAIANTTIDGLDDKMSELRLNEILAPDRLNTGALSLIPPETPMKDISKAVTNVMKTATTATMLGKGIIDSDLSTLDSWNGHKREQKAFVLNSNIGQMMSGLIDFVDDPYNVVTHQPNYDLITPSQTSISSGTYTLSQFIGLYSQFDTVTFDGDVTVTVNPATAGEYMQTIGGGLNAYLIPVFNGITNGGNYTLSFTDGTSPVEMRLAVYEIDGGALTLSKNQYAYSYFDGITAIDGAYATIGDITIAEFKGV